MITINFDTKDLMKLVITQSKINEILTKVGRETVTHIKDLIKKGKNVFNESLISKLDGSVPDFNETGRMLNAMTFKIENNKVILYIDDADREEVLRDLGLKKGKNWIILENSKYIDDFITSLTQKYIDEFYITK